MKKILFLLLMLFTIPLFSQTGVVLQKKAYIYADSVTQSIEPLKGMYISSLHIPLHLTKTLKVDVYNDSTSAWDRYREGGANYILTVDSLIASYIVLPPVDFYSVKKLRFLISKDIADTTYILYDQREY